MQEIEAPRKKPSLREAKRRHDLYLQGCVIRTLASIARAPLTPEQEDIRLDQFNQKAKIVKKIQQFDTEVTGSDIPETIRRISEQGLVEMDDLIATITSQKNSPAGMELSKYRHEWKHLTPAQIKEAVTLGQEVAVITSNTDIFHGHMAHIGLDSKGELIALSDNNEVIVLYKPQNLCLVFTKI